MIKCTYIILIQNNDDTIPKLVDSLKKIEGVFHKEFIFIDDGSTDNSLATLKYLVNDIPRTIIITQETQGPTVSINKAVSIATGEYIQFVYGNEVLHHESTSALIEACLNFGTEVAIGLTTAKNLPSYKINKDAEIISNPIYEILTHKFGPLSNVGKSGSIVHSSLIEKIGKADNSVYTPNISLSLKCAKYTKFAFINKAITTVINPEQITDTNFYAYNKLKSIYNFVKDNPEIFSNMISELLISLSHESRTKYDKSKYRFKAFSNKHIKSIPLKTVLSFYDHELEKLF